MAEANQASLSLLGLALASTEYPVEARPRLFLDPPTPHLLLQVTVHAAPCCSCLRSCLLLWLLEASLSPSALTSMSHPQW